MSASRRDEDPRLRELDRLGIPVALLQEAFGRLVANPDVDFVHEPVAAPTAAEIAPVREHFDKLLDRAKEFMDGREPEKGWDGVGKRMRTLLYWRTALDWHNPAVFFDALARVNGQEDEAYAEPLGRRAGRQVRGQAVRRGAHCVRCPPTDRPTRS